MWFAVDPGDLEDAGMRARAGVSSHGSGGMAAAMSQVAACLPGSAVSGPCSSLGAAWDDRIQALTALVADHAADVVAAATAYARAEAAVGGAFDAGAAGGGAPGSAGAGASASAAGASGASGPGAS